MTDISNRPQFFTCHNGEKAPLPFSAAEYDRRVAARLSSAVQDRRSRGRLMDGGDAAATGDSDPGGESPAAALLGRRVLGLAPESGDLRVEYRARPEFSNRHGTLSGGVLAAMLD